MIEEDARAEAHRPRLLLVVCAAPPTRDIPDVVLAAQAQGWAVSVITTPSARALFDVARVERGTGTPVRSALQVAGTDSLPGAEVVLLAPATFNTLNKVAAGIGDTLATRIVAEAIGARLPLVIAPWAPATLSAHPVFARSLETLMEWGARVVEPPEAAGAGASPWRAALRLVDDCLPGR